MGSNIMSDSSSPPRPCHLPRMAWLVPLLLAGLGGTARAADVQGNFSVRGVGATACSRVIQLVEARGPEVQQLVAWADGALSHANRVERETFDFLPFVNPPGLFTILAVNVCRTNGQLVYGAAVMQALDAIRPLRVRESVAPVTITAGQASVQLRPETIRLVQTRLRELNLLSGQADGQWGGGSRAAMKRFQESSRLPQTEIPDVDSVLRLLLQR